jgi:hypothetical protein
MMIAFSGKVKAQQIQNAEYIMLSAADGGKYILKYDLVSPASNVACKVRVKLTTSEAASGAYLKNLTGDVGDFIFPGTNKEIIWDYANELIHYSGAVNLSIEVVPMIDVSSSVRKGRRLTINYDPALVVDKDKPITLANSKTTSTSLTGDFSGNTITIQTQKKIKTSKNYQIALTVGDKVYYSNRFKIKPQFPLSVIIIPAVGISAYLIYDKIQEDNASLPGPPGSSGLPNN